MNSAERNNPFWGFLHRDALLPDGWFFCRDDELHWLRRHYEAADTQHMVVCITGGRGMGKTSLISQFTQGRPTIWTDLGEDFSDPTLFREEEVVEAIQQKIIDSLDTRATQDSEVRDRPRLVIVLDEFDVLEKHKRKSVLERLLPSIEARVAMPIMWIIVLGSPWNDFTKKDDQPCPECLEIRPMDVFALRAGLRKFEERIGLPRTNDRALRKLAGFLLAWTGGIPMLIAATLFELFELKQEQERPSALLLRELVHASQRSLQREQGRLDHAVMQCGPENLAVLWTISQANSMVRVELIDRCSELVYVDQEKIDTVIDNLALVHVLELRGQSVRCRAKMLKDWIVAYVTRDRVLERATPSSSEAAIHAWENGRSHERSGEFRKALAAYAWARDIDPAFVYAKRAWARCILCLNDRTSQEVDDAIRLISDLAASGPLDSAMFEIRLCLTVHQASFATRDKRKALLDLLLPIPDSITPQSQEWIRRSIAELIGQ